MPDTLWLLAQQAEPLIRRLDPQTRAKVLAALAALVILGMAMVLLVWLGARATRRYMNSGRAASSVKPHGSPDDWADKPIVPSYDEPSSEGP
jgi:hypothetical protein